MPTTIERGDIFFFYRPKVDVEEVNDLDEVQRFYLVLVPDDTDRGRLFIVGRKQMPEIIEGESRSTKREWMMNYVTDSPETIGDDLGAVFYQTETRGERKQPAAIPLVEGRYALYEKHGSTRLGYRMTKPKDPGPAQQTFGLGRAASYIIALRNPKLNVPGFPDRKPDYPPSLEKTFADERWIDIFDPHLLDYENAQLVLIGAHEEVEADIDLSGEPKLFERLGLDPLEWPTEPLDRGEHGTVAEIVGTLPD